MKLIHTITFTLLAFLLTSCLGNGFSFKKQQPPPATSYYKKGKKSPSTNNNISAGKLAGLKGLSSLGNKLDKSDKEYIVRTTQQALETAQNGQVLQWRNPDSGAHGSIKITSENMNEGDNVCRKYSQSVVISGQHINASGKACHQPGSSWLDSTQSEN